MTMDSRRYAVSRRVLIVDECETAKARLAVRLGDAFEVERASSGARGGRGASVAAGRDPARRRLGVAGRGWHHHRARAQGAGLATGSSPCWS